MLEDFAQAAIMAALIWVFASLLGRLLRRYARSKACSWMPLLWEGYMAWRRRRFQARLARRLAAGKDRYFEELRSILAWDPDRVIAVTRAHRRWDLIWAFAVLVLSLMPWARRF
jgi:hypothetical protein